jgi:hypothetical protein
MLKTDYARYKVSFHSPGIKFRIHYRATYEACWDLISREFILRAGSAFDIRYAMIHGTDTPTFERNPQWELVQRRDNALFGKLECHTAASA